MGDPRSGGRWLRRARFLFLACMLPLAAAAVVYCVYATAASPAAQKPLVVEAASLNLGEVWETSRYLFKLPVKNRSGEAVHVANIVGSCSCIQIEPRTLDLAAGEVREIDVAVDLTKAPLLGDGADVRRFEAELFPLLENGRAAGESWPITAWVRSPFRVAPEYVDFGPEVLRDKLPTAKIEVHCFPGAHDFTAVGKDASVEVRVTASPDSPSEFEVAVTPGTSRPGGPLNTAVAFSAEVTGQGKFVKEVPVVGRLLDDVYCVPDCLSFGAVPVGETVEDVVLLRSRSGRKFEVVGIDVDEASGLAAAPSLSPGPLEFQVSQKCAGVGLHKAQVRFLVRREGLSESDVIILPVIQHGVPTR